MLADLTLPVSLSARSGPFVLRSASEDDLTALMALLADDPISAARGDRADDSDRAVYADALRAVQAEQSNIILVAEAPTGEIIGTLQLTRIPGLARRGATRLLVEAVRVSSAQRSTGIGAALMGWVAESAASELGTTLIQLTSDAQRVDAHRFYERLGYTGSHLGFKLDLS